MMRPSKPVAAVPQTAQFEQTTLPYLDSIFRTAHTLLADPVLAERVTQATFAEAWHHRHAMEGDPRVWLFSLLMPQIRIQRHRARPAGEAILAALRSLPTEQGEAVLLADAEGFSSSEVAQILGRESALVQRCLKQGRINLEARLGEN